MSKGWWDRVLTFIGFEPEELPEEFEEVAATREERPAVSQVTRDELASRRARRGLVTVPGGQAAVGRIGVFQPRTFEEVQDVADFLKEGRPVLLNLEELDREIAGRVLNFLSGTVYALNGEMHRVGTGMLLFTPQQVDVQLPLEGIRLASGRLMQDYDER